MKRSRIAAALLLLDILLVSRSAQARLNLPQIRQVVTLPEESVRAIQTHLGPSTPSSHELPASDEALLLSALPQDIRGACSALIEHWGEIARGTAEWRVRLLHQEADQVWLAFRCRSRAPEYVNDYDERPAVLHLESRKLELFPIAKDAENESTLYHLEFAEVLPLEGSQGLAFKIIEPEGNPCCDGPESRSGETWVVFTETPTGVAELLSVVTARDDASHSDDPEVDSETTYRAEVQLERDAGGRVTAVAAAFHGQSKEFSGEKKDAPARIFDKRSGTMRYRWNSASLRFDEIK